MLVGIGPLCVMSVAGPAEEAGRQQTGSKPSSLIEMGAEFAHGEGCIRHTIILGSDNGGWSVLDGTIEW